MMSSPPSPDSHLPHGQQIFLFTKLRQCGASLGSSIRTIFTSTLQRRYPIPDSDPIVVSSEFVLFNIGDTHPAPVLSHKWRWQESALAYATHDQSLAKVETSSSIYWEGCYIRGSRTRIRQARNCTRGESDSPFGFRCDASQPTHRQIA